MRSLHFVGQMLVLCLPGLVSFVPAAQTRAPRPHPSPAEPAHTVSVWHREAGHYRRSVDLPIVTEVRSVLARAAELSGPDLDMSHLAFATLSTRFGSRVVLSSSLAHYVWVLINGEWVIVCVSQSTFEVDFGQWGTVIVQTSDSMSVPE